MQRPKQAPRSAQRRALLGLALALAGSTACQETAKPSPPAPETRSAPAASASAAPGTSAAPAASTATVKPAASAAPAAQPDLSPSLWSPPEKPSKPPSVAEWAAAPDVDVKNAKRLGCEIKSVREWLRVSCRTTADSASQIKELRWLEPSVKPLDFYDMTKPGALASIVFPIRRETKARIEFVWTDFSRVLSVAWAPGTPRPLVYFSGDAPKDLSKPLCTAVCGIPYFPGRGTMPCPPTHDPTNPDEDNGCICRMYRDKQCTTDW